MMGQKNNFIIFWPIMRSIKIEMAGLETLFCEKMKP